MTDAWYISSDSHMSEPLDLWTTRMDAKFRDRAPHVEDEYDGVPGAWWVYEGYQPHDLAVGVAGGQSRSADEKDEFMKTGGYADARPGGWDPAERLKDMAIDGVAAEVLYTTLGFRLFWLQDPVLQRECFRVYNDWLAEYCSYAPERLKGLALVSLYDPNLAAEELERGAKMGLSGAMIWASPPEDQPYHLDMYDVFWSRAQELGMPLSLHPPTGMERPKYEFWAGRTGFCGQSSRRKRYRNRLRSSSPPGCWNVPHSQCHLCRYGVGWVPFWLGQVDKHGGARLEQTRRLRDASQHETDGVLRPPGVRHLHRRRGGIQYRGDIGVDRVMWSSDYPHAASTWPKSREFIERDFAGPEAQEDMRKIVHDNCVALYGFPSYLPA